MWEDDRRHFLKLSLSFKMSSAGSVPAGSAATLTSIPAESASDAERRDACMPALSASKTIKIRLESRLRDTSCSLVKAVPDDATAFLNPPWWHIKRSICPST